jgi:hypothetical protein
MSRHLSIDSKRFISIVLVQVGICCGIFFPSLWHKRLYNKNDVWNTFFHSLKSITMWMSMTINYNLFHIIKFINNFVLCFFCFIALFLLSF